MNIYIGEESLMENLVENSSLTSNYYNKTQIDASYGVVDASLLAFDASIKAIAASGGSGGGSSATKLSDL